MNPREPVRLLEEDSEASAELRELLGAASLDEPSAEQLASLAGKLGPLLEAPVETAPETPAQRPSEVGGAAPVGTGLKTKVLTGLAMAVLAGGSFQAGRVFERERATERPETVAVAPAPAPSPEPAPAPEPARADATSSRVPEEPSEKPAPKPSTAPAPRVPRARAPDAPVAPAEAETMDEELSLLESAYEALRKGDAAGALAEAERHAARFPSGALAQEREVLAIDALVRLGRRAEAEARAAGFRARYPTSTHGVRIQGLLSGPRP